MNKSFAKGLFLGIAGSIGGIIIGVVAAIFGILAIFLFATIGAVMGAITGYILSIVPILGLMVENGFTAIFQIENPNMAEIGAMLGFIGGFFKSSNSHNCEHKDGDFNFKC
jgi:hypothetical protein